MNWQEEYSKKLMPREEAVSRFVKNGDVVGFGGLAFAKHTVNGIVEQVKAGKLNNITLIGNLIADYLPIDTPDISPDMINYKSFFFGSYERAAVKNKTVSYVPITLEGWTRYVRDVARPNVAVCQVTPTDDNGNMSLGPINGGTMPILLQCSERIIVQVNRNLPWSYGPVNTIHISEVSAVIEFDDPLPHYQVAEVTERDQTIADFILEHIEDGACIQLGLGGTANAVGYGLRDKHELGIHSEMFTESMRALHELGVITNNRKQYMPGVSVAGFTLANDPTHYQFLDKNKYVNFCPYYITNSVEIIASNNNMISINNALSIDLTGQVTAESIGFRQFSGTGGQVDFVRGATAAKNGKSFIAVSSAVDTKDGFLSRIVLNFPPGTAVTTLRTEVQYVVTEYGCVNLYGMDMPERVKRLISVAHPAFREKLTFDAKKVGYLY